MMSQPVLVLGGGGHAKVVIDVLLQQKKEIIGFSDPDVNKVSVLGVSRIGNDNDILLRYSPLETFLINGLGPIATNTHRQQLYNKFKKAGFCFESLVHPSAELGLDVRLGEGCQVMAGAVIQSGSTIGSNTIVNTRASVDHDCRLGAHVHIAPGAILCGHVQVDDGGYIGAGASIIQGIQIGENATIGAGAAVVRHVQPGATVVGVPAKERK